MARIKMHIPKAKLPFYPPCEVKCRLQNRVSTLSYMFGPLFYFILLWRWGIAIKEALHEALHNLIELFIPFLHAEEEKLHLENNQQKVTSPFFTCHDRLAKPNKNSTDVDTPFCNLHLTSHGG